MESRNSTIRLNKSCIIIQLDLINIVTNAIDQIIVLFQTLSKGYEFVQQGWFQYN